MKQLLVVAAALFDSQNRVLVAQRPAGKSLAGLWEFPGGKLDPGETPETALARELTEELGITVAEYALLPLGFASHAYPEFHLLMLLYSCTSWSGAPHGREGQPIAWETPAALTALPMPPADIPLIDVIKAFVADR